MEDIFVTKVGVDKMYKYTAEKKHKVWCYIIVALIFSYTTLVFYWNLRVCFYENKSGRRVATRYWRQRKIFEVEELKKQKSRQIFIVMVFAFSFWNAQFLLRSDIIFSKVNAIGFPYAIIYRQIL